MNKSITLALFSILLLFEILPSNAVAWENEKTHPAITDKAVKLSVLGGDYLQTQLGMNEKLGTKLLLTEQYQNNLVRRAGQKRPTPKVWNTTESSILDWLKAGSEFEDIPNPRARHHFYNPIWNEGLNNVLVEPFSDIHGLIYYGSTWFYPDYWGFNLLGGSAAKRALGCADDWGTDWESEPEYLTTKYNWPTARNLFYIALTSENKEDRDANLGAMFVVLGHICHLLEDMGVPAHTRNDFLWGHLVGHNYKKQTGVKDPWKLGGNPFEAWMEEQIKNNDDQIPSVYLARLMDTPPAFAKFEDYWDTGICVESGIPQWQGDSPGWPGTGFGNPPPEKSWGLAECTNYQFLSYSTIFRNILSVQHFPHPDKEHTRVDWYASGPNGAKQYYRIGYDVPHLTRSTYTAYLLGDLAFWNTDTTEEKKVYEDYAKRTISRTVDYTTGLLNYFFRGRLSVQLSYLTCEEIRLNITNLSQNSGINQSLKGGIFELYWDDPNGNRTEVAEFIAFDSNDPADNDVWSSGCILPYGQSIRAEFPKPAGAVEKFILVYKGNICQNPAEPDTDDSDALAVAIITNPGCPFASNDCCCFLDPSTPTWDSNTVYGIGNLVEYWNATYKSNADNNINHQPYNNPAWWTKVSNTVSCDNENWNAHPPFGGIGKSPKYLSLTISGAPTLSPQQLFNAACATSCDYSPGNCDDLGPSPTRIPSFSSHINRTYILSGGKNCCYGCGNDCPTIEQSPSIAMSLCSDESHIILCWADVPYAMSLDNPSSPPLEGDGEEIHGDSSGAQGITCERGEGWEGLFYHVSGTWQIGENVKDSDNNIRGTVGGLSWFYSRVVLFTPKNTPICSVFDGHQISSQQYFYLSDWCYDMEIPSYNDVKITVQPIATPPSYPVWILSYDYNEGDIVIGSDGGKYVCNIPHTSTTDTTPISGANWQNYWSLVTECY